MSARQKPSAASGTPTPPPSCYVYTPPELAESMVHALGDAPGATWLEPSHGRGAFLQAMARSGVGSGRIVALDLDPRASSADRLANTTRGVDFLQWAKSTERRFDRIVGNPPFLAISQLPPGLQEAAATTQDLHGRAIGKGANLWYAFVLASIRLLREGGCLAFVLPSAAEFANYSAVLRESVPRRFASLEIYRCVRPLFNRVQEGTLVVVGRGYGRGPGLVSRLSFDTPAGLTKRLSTGARPNGHRCPGARPSEKAERMTLGSIAAIGLGGVTGDAPYFLMNEEKRASMRLPLRAFTPVVSKARHLRAPLLTQGEWDGLRATGERVWLFNPSETAATLPSVKDYLQLKRSQGGCNRHAYKVSTRDPWHRTPLPPNPDAFLSGMSQHGPWLCINETGRVNATNTLYVVRFSSRNRSEWFMWALALLSSQTRRQLRRIGRRYPDGLIKYEPGPLSAIEIPTLKPGEDYKSLYVQAASALLNGNVRLATEIADSVSD